MCGGSTPDYTGSRSMSSANGWGLVLVAGLAVVVIGCGQGGGQPEVEPPAYSGLSPEVALSLGQTGACNLSVGTATYPATCAAVPAHATRYPEAFEVTLALEGGEQCAFRAHDLRPLTTVEPSWRGVIGLKARAGEDGRDLPGCTDVLGFTSGVGASRTVWIGPE